MNRDDIQGVVAILLVGAYAGFVAVCAFRRIALPATNPPPDGPVGPPPNQKAAFDLLAAYHRDYRSYYTQKENMAWLVATIGVAAAIAVLRAEPPPGFKNWPDVVFWLFFVLCLATAIAVLLLLQFQNVNRHRGAAMFEAAANTYVHWLSNGPRIPEADLKPIQRFDYPRHELPAAVARRYAELLAKSTPPAFERLGYVVVGGWAVAALLRIAWARFAS